jgi:hypothetical protein
MDVPRRQVRGFVFLDAAKLARLDRELEAAESELLTVTRKWLRLRRRERAWRRLLRMTAARFRSADVALGLLPSPCPDALLRRLHAAKRNAVERLTALSVGDADLSDGDRPPCLLRFQRDDLRRAYDALGVARAKVEEARRNVLRCEALREAELLAFLAARERLSEAEREEDARLWRSRRPRQPSHESSAHEHSGDQ